MKHVWEFVKSHETMIHVMAAIATVVTIVLGVMWFRNPTGNFEPLIFVIGAAAGLLLALPSLAKRFSPDPALEPVPPPPARPLSIDEMSADQIFEIVENSNPDTDWIRTDEIGTWSIYHRRYPKLNFFCDIYEDRYIMNSDFKEPWANKFMDPKATAFYYDLRLGDRVLKRFPLISVDGHRALLPLPDFAHLSVDRLAYKVARINDETGQTDEYMSRAGLSIKDA